jgi:hypothetical protein
MKKDMKSYKLTNQQESIIWSMYMAEIALHKEGLWFSSGYFSMALGIMWNQYYRQLMEDLCELGWCERMFSRGMWNYQLTPAARVNRDESWSYAKRDIRNPLGAETRQMSLWDVETER